MITLAWADMEKYTNGIDVFSNDYIPENEDVSLRMTFDNPIDLKHEWDKISDWPVSMWYWVLVDDNDLICSGGCSPADLEEIIIPWFGLESILENEERFETVEMAHIILYADEFDYAVWEEYCSICQESPSAISLRIPFNIFDVRATFDEENENEE